MVKHGNKALSHVLIQWKDTARVDATWEYHHPLLAKFPQFDSEGVVAYIGQGDCQGTGPNVSTSSPRIVAEGITGMD